MHVFLENVMVGWFSGTRFSVYLVRMFKGMETISREVSAMKKYSCRANNKSNFNN